MAQEPAAPLRWKPMRGSVRARLITALVARFIHTLAFGRRCIRPRGIARRSNTPGILPPRAFGGPSALLSPGPSVRHRMYEADHLGIVAGAIAVVLAWPVPWPARRTLERPERGRRVRVQPSTPFRTPEGDPVEIPSSSPFTRGCY